MVEQPDQDKTPQTKPTENADHRECSSQAPAKSRRPSVFSKIKEKLQGRKKKVKKEDPHIYPLW